MATTNNYTLGRGELYFARYKDGTEIPEGERYLGNTPEFNLTIEQETLDHFSSDFGIREKDESIALQVNRTGSLTTDNIDPENVALFFFGEKSDAAVAAASGLNEVFEAVTPGLYYQIGASPSTPAGVKGLASATLAAEGTTLVAATGTLTATDQPVDGETVTIGTKVYTFQDTLTNVDGHVKIGASLAASLTNLKNAINGTGGVPGTDYAAATVAHTLVTATSTGTTVVVTAKSAGTGGNSIATTATYADASFGGATLTGGSGTAYVLGTDYDVDLTLGRIEILDGGAIVEGTDVEVFYALAASSRSRIISGSAPVQGQLRYVARNPKGENIDYLMPKVNISPNGDYALKGDDWQTIPFNLEILKKDGYEAIYAEGRPVFA